MANPRQQIHSWLMQQQIPKGIGARSHPFSGVASKAPGVFGAGSRFGAPMPQQRHDRFTPLPQAGDSNNEGPNTARKFHTPLDPKTEQYTRNMESELPPAADRSEEFERRYHAKQRMNGAPVSLDPEANVSEALHFAQNENRMAPVRYADNIQQQVRKFPIKQSLEEKVSRSVYDTFGPGHTVEIGSGGQPRAGTVLEAHNMTWVPSKRGYRGRIGTTNHDHGRAADIRIIGPDGQPLPRHKLGNFVQHWYANNHGRAATGLARGGVHVDARKDAGYYEYKDGKADSNSTVMKKWADRGKAGELPELYQSEGVPESSMSATELGLEDPMVASGTARLYGTFDDADPQVMANETYEYAKLLPEDPYREPFIPKPKHRPAR